MPALSLARLIGPYAICLLVGFVAAWLYQGNRYSAKIDRMVAEAADARAAATVAAKEQTDEQQRKVAVIDAHRTKDLTDARTENDRLRVAVAAGDRRLRIALAARPACLPDPAANPGVDHGAAAELSAEAGRAVLDLRAGLIELEARYSACRDVVLALPR